MWPSSLFNDVIYCGVSLEAVTGINPRVAVLRLLWTGKGDGRTVRALGEPFPVSGAGSGPSGFPSIRGTPRRGNSYVLQEPRILRWVCAPLGSVRWPACLSEPWVPASQSETGMSAGSSQGIPWDDTPHSGPSESGLFGSCG